MRARIPVSVSSSVPSRAVEVGRPVGHVDAQVGADLGGECGDHVAHGQGVRPEVGVGSPDRLVGIGRVRPLARADVPDLDVIGGDEPADARLLRLVEGVRHPALEVEAVLDEQVGMGDGLDVPGGRLPFVGVGPIRHQDDHVGPVADEVLHDRPEDRVGDHDRRAVARRRRGGGRGDEHDEGGPDREDKTPEVACAPPGARALRAASHRSADRRSLDRRPAGPQAVPPDAAHAVRPPSWQPGHRPKSSSRCSSIR